MASLNGKPGHPEVRQPKIVKASLLGRELVEFIPHALDRMKGRGIKEEEVLQILRKPDKKGLPTQPGRQRVRKYKSAKTAIDVVYELAEDRVVVITVMCIDRQR